MTQVGTTIKVISGLRVPENKTNSDVTFSDATKKTSNVVRSASAATMLNLSYPENIILLKSIRRIMFGHGA